MFGIKVEADLEGDMLYIVNDDKPGFIGRLGSTLGEAGINIGTFHLGRRSAGGEAVLLLSVDSPVQGDLLKTVCSLPGVRQRSEEHTSELQSLMRISYAVFCLKKQKSKLSHTY